MEVKLVLLEVLKVLLHLEEALERLRGNATERVALQRHLEG